MNAPYDIVRHSRARAVRLAIDPASGRARLVVPKRASLAKAVAWAETKTAWLSAQRELLPRPRPFVDGADLPVADDVLTIRHDPLRPRRIERLGTELHVGGPAEGMSRRIESWLKRHALERLTAETLKFARNAHVTVANVTVGDPRGRWGSCAAHGAIRYSWRLILAPGYVLRATAAHEVAHRIQMNHGPQFHALVAELLDDDPTRAREWLRAHGASLHWFGRSSD